MSIGVWRLPYLPIEKEIDPQNRLPLSGNLISIARHWSASNVHLQMGCSPVVLQFWHPVQEGLRQLCCKCFAEATLLIWMAWWNQWKKRWSVGLRVGSRKNKFKQALQTTPFCLPYLSMSKRVDLIRWTLSVTFYCFCLLALWGFRYRRFTFLWG